MADNTSVGDFVVARDNQIGRGGFGVVFTAINVKSKLKVAAKRLSRWKTSSKESDELPKDVEAELIALKKGLRHKNILEVYDYHADKECFWLFMELCDVDLDKYMQQNCNSLNYISKLSMMHQMVSGLSFLHQNKIVHRDLKPTNVLLVLKDETEPSVKITDFGTAKLLSEEDLSEMHTYAGTEEFMAPELLQLGSDGRLHYKKSVDTFSLGLVFLAMEQATKGQPLKPVIEERNISVKEASVTIGRAMSLRKEAGKEYIRVASLREGDDLVKQHVKDLINQMTNTEPRHRPDVEKVGRKFTLLFDEVIQHGADNVQLLQLAGHQYSTEVDSKCPVTSHKGQDLVFQCVEKGCNKPVCEMCITDQHLEHEIVEIDDFIYTQGNRISRQKFTKYSTSMEEFSVVLSETSSNFDKIFEKISEEYRQMQQPLEDDIIEWRMKTNVILTRLIERVQNHRKEIRNIIVQINDIGRETNTFRSLSMITTVLDKMKLLFQSDVEINSELKKIYKENIPEHVAEQCQNHWAAVTGKLTQNKDNAYYPHFDMHIDTRIDQSYRNTFLCSTRDGAFFVAGMNVAQKFEILLSSRLGELVWKRELVSESELDGEDEVEWVTEPAKKFNRVDDIEEIEDQNGTRWILCSNSIEHQIVKVSFSDGSVEEVVFEDPTMVPFLMAAAPENSRLYVVDGSQGTSCVQALDTTTSPYQVIPTWEPLEIQLCEPTKLLHLPQTKSLLIAVRSKDLTDYDVLAIKEDSTIAWQLDELEANSLSLAPNGTILIARSHSVLLFTQEGQCIYEYRFRELKIINEAKWFQGYLMILHSVDEMVHITAKEALCPTSPTLPEGQVEVREFPLQARLPQEVPREEPITSAQEEDNDRYLCRRHNEPNIEMCVQPRCMKPICERCKTTTHKDHKFMELPEYKDKCSEDLKIFEISLKAQLEITEKALEIMKAEISRSDKSENIELKGMIQGDTSTEKKESRGDQFRASQLLDRLTKQKETIRTTQEKIEEATNEFVLDPLDSIELTKQAYEVLKTVLEEQHQLLKILSTNGRTKDHASTCTVYPKVEVNTGIGNFLEAKQFMMCRNGDVTIVGIDTLLDQWRLRRFSRLGQLERDMPLPMLWTECHGIADFSKNEKAILLANAEKKKIILVKEDDRESKPVICYTDERKGPIFLALSPHLKRLFFKDIYSREQRIEVLDASTIPFTPVQTITLGFSIPSDIAYLGGDKELLLFTSYEKYSIRAINCHDGREKWTVGPFVLGRKCRPLGLSRIENGEFLVADGENKRVLRLNADGDITGILSIGAKEKSSKMLPLVSLVAFDDDHIAVGYSLKSGELIAEWYNMEDISAVREEPQDVYETTLKVTCESGHLLEPYLDIKSNKLKIARRLSSKVRQFYGLPDGWEQVSGIAEFVTIGESKILVSNQNQPFIILLDEAAKRFEAVYHHEVQRATRMCTDKSSMELYFIDVSVRPLHIQVLSISSKPFEHKRTIETGLYNGSDLCLYPWKSGIIMASREESLIRMFHVDTGDVLWQQGPDVEDVLLAPEAVRVGEDGRVIVTETLKKRFIEFHPDAGYCEVIETDFEIVLMKAENELRNQRLQNLLKALRDMLLLLEGEEKTSSEHQICASRTLKLALNALEMYRTNRDIQLVGCQLIYDLAESYFGMLNPEEKQLTINILVHHLESYIGDYDLMVFGFLPLTFFDWQDMTFVFGHLVDVLLKVIKEMSAEIHEEGSGRDAFAGEVMKMLCDLAYSKAVPDAQEIFASKGANQMFLKIIQQKLDQNTCDVMFLDCWSILLKLTDDCEENVQILVDSDIIEMAMACKKFGIQPELADDILHLMANLSEYQLGRQRMMTCDFLSLLMNLEPIIRLLEIKHTPCVIEWAVWLLRYLITEDVKQYRPLLLRESGLSKLHALLDDPSISRRIKSKSRKLQIYVKLTINILVHHLESYIGDYDLMVFGFLPLTFFDWQDMTFVFGHLVDVLLKVIKEMSAEIHEEGSGRDVFAGEVMKMLCDLAYSKAVPDAQEIFASKGANQMFLKIIQQRLDQNVCDVMFLDCWSILLKLTDDCEENVQILLDNDIIEMALACKKFGIKPELADDVLHLMANLSEYQLGRERMMRCDFLALLIRNISTRERYLFHTLAILVQLLSDGEEAWTLETPFRQTAIALVQRTVRQYPLPVDLDVLYSNLEPIIRLLEIKHTPCVVEWAVWLLRYLITEDVKQYRPLLLQESGLSKLHALLDDPSISRRIKIQIQKITNLCKVSKCSKPSKTSRRSKQKAKPDSPKGPVAGIVTLDGGFIPLRKGKDFISIKEISNH